MVQTVNKHRRLEIYLNNIKFKKINIGSLLAEEFIINSYHQSKINSFRNILVLIKYILTIFSFKNNPPVESEYIITKSHNRFHYNALMDPIVIHYLNKATIICDENAFESSIRNLYPINSQSLDESTLISNSFNDIYKILKTTFKTIWILFSRKKRLAVSYSEIILFGSILLIQLRRVSFWTRYFSQLKSKPKCIITEFDRCLISSALISTAKIHNILTITLTHGVITQFCNTPILADQVFCWGRTQRDQLISLGIDQSKISITGNPMIKLFKKLEENDIKPNSKLIFCLAISPEDNLLNRLLIEKFIYAIEQFNQIRGIIKLHPSLCKDNFMWVNTISPEINIVDSIDVVNSDLFEKIDVLVVHYSGIANEGLAANVPVVILNPQNSSNLNEIQTLLIQQARCKIANDKTELIRIFKEIVTDPIKYKIESANRSSTYLKNLFETIGEDSVKVMIAEIDRLTGTN